MESRSGLGLIRGVEREAKPRPSQECRELRLVQRAVAIFVRDLEEPGHVGGELCWRVAGELQTLLCPTCGEMTMP